MEENDEINEKLRRYLDGELSPEELTDFETEIAQSEELQEQVALHRQIDAFNDEEGWSLYEGDTQAIKDNIPLFEDTETKEFSDKLKDFRSGPDKSTVLRPKRKSHWAIAMAVAAGLVLIFYLALPKGASIEDLYVEHSNWDELPSLTVKGDANAEAEIEQLFLQENYGEVISKIDAISIFDQSSASTLLLYKGVSQLELDQYKDALQTFETLIESNLIDNHKGYWYSALVHLKKGDKAAAIEALEVVAAKENYFRNKEAKELLKELE